MQWLIDIVTEWIAANHGYFHLGNSGNYDYLFPFWNQTAGWHTIDFSAFVPVGTRAVHFSMKAANTAASQHIRFRAADLNTPYRRAHFITQAANLPYWDDMFIPLDSYRQAEYSILLATWTDITGSVIGYLL